MRYFSGRLPALIMLARKYKKTGMLVLMVLLFTSCNLIRSAPPGYCRGRVVPDEELIGTAVFVSSGRGMQVDGSARSIRDFHENNPHCCSVTRDTAPLLNRLLVGEIDIEVNVYYKLDAAWRAEDPAMPDYYENHVQMDACGKVGAVFGMAIESKDLPNGVR
jgi:hypothetical protein